MLAQLCRRSLTRSNFIHDACRAIHTTPVNTTFYEKEKKSGYGKKYPMFSKQMMLEGFQQLKEEIKLWKEEVKEKFESDPLVICRPGETDIAWRFNEQKDFEKWTCTADSDHNEGTSTATFERSPAGFALFQGNLSKDMPQGGKIKRSGYCGIRSMRARKSFKRETEFNWTLYNTLVMKVRGDGRPYLINISCEGEFDITWNDIYHYVLHTRGGPHWQITKIPFSKFFYASKGRVQDLQTSLPLHRVTHLGFAVSGRGGYAGKFNLEIDYIGLEYDPAITEDFAYEMYKMDKYIVAT